MNTLKKILSGSLVALVLSATAGEAAAATYGQAIDDRQITAIRDILADPKGYENKTVTIEGKIAEECPTGCWFYVKVAKGGASIYVDVAPGGFAIPQQKGKKILVRGKVISRAAGPMIEGKGAEIR